MRTLVEHGRVEIRPAGLCGCGCGLPVPIAKQTDPRKGWVKGEPLRFISGHNSRVRPHQDPGERFWSQVDKDGPIIRPELGPCWLWTGYRNKAGYGLIWFNGRMRLAHQVSLELAGWIIPFEWLQALHTCANPPCVRPNHLRIDTKQANEDDKVSKGRQTRGERAGGAKLTPANVLEILSIYRAGGTTHKALAKRFGVSRRNIGRILCGEGWQHVTQQESREGATG